MIVICLCEHLSLRFVMHWLSRYSKLSNLMKVTFKQFFVVNPEALPKQTRNVDLSSHNAFIPFSVITFLSHLMYEGVM